MDDVDGCLACDLFAGRQVAPGGTLAETDLWAVQHCVGPLGVGTLIVKPKRHVVHVAELSAEEAAELGPLLRRAAAAVTAVRDPHQVYVCLWSHAGNAPGHIHWVVQPAEASDDDSSRGPALQAAMFEAGELPDPAEIEEIAPRLRAALATEAP